LWKWCDEPRRVERQSVRQKRIVCTKTNVSKSKRYEKRRNKKRTEKNCEACCARARWQNRSWAGRPPPSELGSRMMACAVSIDTKAFAHCMQVSATLVCCT
jgi:hypothetical protein